MARRSAPLLASEPIERVLAEGRQAYVAVAAARGPHVTPVLYGYDDGRLGFIVADDTLKAKVLRRRPQAGVVVQARDRFVAMVGDVAAIDPARPWEVAAGATTHRAAPLVVSHGLRNLADLVGFGVDFLGGRLGYRLPSRRTLFVFAPRWAMVLESGRVVDTVGVAAPVETESADLGLGAGDVGAGTGVVVALGTEPPLALPGRWEPERSVASVSAAALAVAGRSGTGPVAVVADEYRRPGPAAKGGILLRGEGRARRQGAVVRIKVTPDRASTWDGAVTETVRLGGGGA